MLMAGSKTQLVGKTALKLPEAVSQATAAPTLPHIAMHRELYPSLGGDKADPYPILPTPLSCAIPGPWKARHLITAEMVAPVHTHIDTLTHHAHGSIIGSPGRGTQLSHGHIAHLHYPIWSSGPSRNTCVLAHHGHSGMVGGVGGGGHWVGR